MPRLPHLGHCLQPVTVVLLLEELVQPDLVRARIGQEVGAPVDGGGKRVDEVRGLPWERSPWGEGAVTAIGDSKYDRSVLLTSLLPAVSPSCRTEGCVRILYRGLVTSIRLRSKRRLPSLSWGFGCMQSANISIEPGGSVLSERVLLLRCWISTIAFSLVSCS